MIQYRCAGLDSNIFNDKLCRYKHEAQLPNRITRCRFVIQARCAGLDSNIFNDKTLQVFLLNGIGLIVQARS
ncbi:MAG: hypothetical protein LIO77_09930, partial [Rikenellaceae bacterium]|nr:hypothetical protein [Rikenellaceae bacterium]